MKDVNNPVCPFCHYRVRESIVRIQFLTQKQTDKGKWIPISTLIAEDCTPIMLWHMVSKVFPDERADRTIMAYVRCYQGKWMLINNACMGMYSNGGGLVPKDYAVNIVDGMNIRLTSQGVIMHFEVINN